MVNRIRKALAEKDQGFTLIELLVVIIIIGILAAIAIPVFLNQRKKGVDAGLKSDLKNAATAIETELTDTPTATAAQIQAVLADATKFKASAGNTVAVTGTGLTGYCITAENDGSSRGAGVVMSYDSDGGGVVPNWGACT